MTTDDFAPRSILHGQVFHLVTKYALTYPLKQPGQSLCGALNLTQNPGNSPNICRACDGLVPHARRAR